jgi:arylsulfatase A-like enzyme
LISIDTLRPDHLGSYGYFRDTSPTLDRLAAEGVLFENHISSSSWTLPAHAALFTSLADSVHGCSDTDRTLHEDFVTLAERFSEAGYATAGFFAGPYLHPAFGLGQGFDHYENLTSYRRILDENPASRWAMDLDLMKASHQDITNPSVHRAVRKWLEGRGDRPFFLFIHLWDVHFDFIPPAPYDTRFDPDYRGEVSGRNFFFDHSINRDMPARDREHLVALYDGEIAWTDVHVGKILADLEAAGLARDVVLTVTADHGTEFFEHGYKGHRTTLFDEQIRIPLILHYPRALPSGLRIAQQTRIIDLGPTLLELAGVNAPQDVMGRSLLPLIRGSEKGSGRAALSELFSVGKRMRAVRTSRWKYLHDDARGRLYFFDLSEDPAEARPRTRFDSELGREVLAVSSDVMARLEAARRGAGESPRQGRDLPEELRRQLESLGYIEE